jgi:hypothetical protein
MAETDKLAGYRGDPKSIPQPVEDGTAAPPAMPHEGEDAAARNIATAPPVASPLVTGDRTPAFQDRQRQAIANRFKAERAAERKESVPASHVPFIDGDNPAIPGAIPVEGAAEPAAPSEPTEPADLDAAAREKERIEGEELAARAAAERQATTKTYLLKVDGNQFSVSREELLRYAEVDPADAEQFSEVALQRLAQKQIAFSNRLAEANALKDQARRQTPPAPAQTVAPAPAASPTRPDPALISAIEKIQLGDPEEAARALQEVFDAGVSHALRTNDHTRAMGSVQQEYARAVENFAADNHHIIASPYLSRAHISFVAGEIADDIKALGLVDDNQYAAIATNPRLAADVLTAALVEGRPVRSPDKIFRAASDKLAETFGIADANIGQTRPNFTPVPPQPRVAPSRIEEKRALMPQLARSGISNIGTGAPEPAPADDRIAVHSAAIQKMRKARFQPTS